MSKAGLGGAFATPSTNFLLDNRDQVRQYYGLPSGRLPDDPNRLFKQTEKTYSVYGMANYAFDVGPVSVSGVGGVEVTSGTPSGCSMRLSRSAFRRS